MTPNQLKKLEGHTPPRWYNKAGTIRADDPERDGLPPTICEVDPRDINLTEFAANSELIAAAPRLLAERNALLAALEALTACARTFRNVPKDEQEWTPLDDEALNAAFSAIDFAEKE